MAERKGATTRRKSSSGGVWFRPGPRGGAWWIDFTAAGKRHRMRTRALSRVEAGKIRATLLSDAERGELRFPGKSVGFHVLADEYLEWAKTNKGASTWQRDEWELRAMKDFFGDVAADTITLERCEAFKAARTQALGQSAWAKASQRPGTVPTVRKSTVNRSLSVLKHLFTWARRRGKMTANPALDVRRHKEDPTTFYEVSPEEEVLLLAVAEKRRKAPHLAPFLAVALHTGGRLSEVLTLRWENVDLERRRVEFVKTKSGKSRTVKLNVFVAGVLKAWQERAGASPFVFPGSDGRPIVSIKTAWHKVAAEVAKTFPRFERCRIHDCRHTFGSRLAAAGVDLVTIKDLMGHSSIVITQRYLHSSDKRKADAVELLVAGAASRGTNAAQIQIQHPAAASNAAAQVMVKTG